MTWYQYFFTQCRALFVYIGMFLLPVQLNADWDFPISRTLLDHGAIVGLAALLALTAAAWHYRRRFPLACYGFFLFLVLMAPTSSILPIRDPIAERRLYFAMPGLILIVVDLLDRDEARRGGSWQRSRRWWRSSAAAATHARAEAWSDAVLLWQDTVRKSPTKVRAHLAAGIGVLRAEAVRPGGGRIRTHRPTGDRRATTCWRIGGCATTT